MLAEEPEESAGLMEDLEEEGGRFFGLAAGLEAFIEQGDGSDVHADATHAGGALMEEVLSQYTDFSPPSSPKSARVGRGMAGAPPLPGSWSLAHSIEGSCGRSRIVRKYQMQAFDRGAGNIKRPDTAPPPYVSPSSPLFNASARSQSATPGPSSNSPRVGGPTSKSAARDRVPRTAQQFPAIVSSRVTSSSMAKVKNQDGLKDLFQETILPMDLLSRRKDGRPYLMTSTDEEKPPFRLNKHPRLIDRKMVYTPERKTLSRKSTVGEGRLATKGRSTFKGRSSSKGGEKVKLHLTGHRAIGAHSGVHIEDNVDHPGERSPSHRAKVQKQRSLASFLARRPSSPTDGGKTRASQRTSQAPHHAGAIGEENDEVARPKNAIWKLNLQSSKDDRLERLSIHRKIKESELLIGDRDKVVTREEVDLAEDSFYRYYKKSTFHEYSQESIVAALADFGIRARVRPEKLALLQVLVDYDDPSREFTFKDFCSVVEEARLKIRSVRFSSLFLAWRNVDIDDIGALDRNQVHALLEILNCSPAAQGDVALVMIDTWIEDLHKDSFGLISLGEVEYLVQQCREHQEVTRRRHERHIQEQYKLSGITFQEFRSQLIDLHEAFTKMVQETIGNIGVDEVYELLAHFGITTESTGMSKMRLQAEIHSFMTQADASKIAFPWLLMFIRGLRTMVMDERSDEVRSLFTAYDKDRSEALDMKEICHILVDLSLQPKSPGEQDGIAELLEEVDFDGTGTLSFDELLGLVIRISERIAQIQRISEQSRAEVLGFSQAEAMELRRAFEALDADDSGALSGAEIVRAIHWMQWKVPVNKIHELIEDVDEDHSGMIDFSEFLELMRRVDEDVKALAGDHAPPVVETHAQQQQKKDPAEAPSTPAHTETAVTEKQLPDKAANLRRRRGKAAVHASMAGGMTGIAKQRGTVIRPSG